CDDLLGCVMNFDLAGDGRQGLADPLLIMPRICCIVRDRCSTCAENSMAQLARVRTSVLDIASEHCGAPNALPVALRARHCDPTRRKRSATRPGGRLSCLP